MSTAQATRPRGWRIKNLAKEYQVSESFLKQAFYEGRLKGKKFDKVIVVLDKDAREFFGDYEEEAQEQLQSFQTAD